MLIEFFMGKRKQKTRTADIFLEKNNLREKRREKKGVKWDFIKSNPKKTVHI